MTPPMPPLPLSTEWYTAPHIMANAFSPLEKKGRHLTLSSLLTGNACLALNIKMK